MAAPLLHATDDTHRSRLRAVAARDRDADGHFVYAVTTTGVYCRPSCPSRKPKAENTVFFDTPRDAESAGYRPCKRCNPRDAAQPSSHAAMVAEACRLIEAEDGAPSLDALAARAGLSPWHFHRVFKSHVGVTPKAYAAAVRARRLAEKLGDPDATVTDAVYEAGYGSSSRAYAAIEGRLGMTPTSYRKGGEGEIIRYAVAPCSLGLVLVAGTPRGICAIEFGDDADALVGELRARLPRATLKPAEADFHDWLETVLSFIEAPAKGLDLPLDIRGTAFQQRVWAALRDIPPGTTLTYAELARKIGRPSATRAVARACASNRIAVAIPCHRVIRTDGTLAGYHWGMERKQALLEREGRPGEDQKGR